MPTLPNAGDWVATLLHSTSDFGSVDAKIKLLESPAWCALPPGLGGR